MSRIGKQPIKIPENVDIKFDNGEVVVKGPKGELSQRIHHEIDLEITDSEVILKRKKERNSSALWGLMRALVANMVQGVTKQNQMRKFMELSALMQDMFTLVQLHVILTSPFPPRTLNL